MRTIHLSDLPAMWERCKITVQGETLQPGPPFTQYNLFDWYFPYGHTPERDQRSLHYEFLRVDATQVDAVVDFCERFGLLRIVDEGKGPDIVDAMLEEDTDPKDLEQFPSYSVAAARLARYDDTPSAPGGFRSLTLQEFQTAQDRLRRLMTWAQTWQLARSRDEAREARFNLRQLVNPKLRFVYPRLMWDDQQARWVTGWDIRSLEAAMYLMVLQDLQGGGLIRTCPWDHTIFLGDRRTRYCSPRCQNAHNVRQFRQRTREEPARESSKTAKTRLSKLKTSRKKQRNG